MPFLPPTWRFSVGRTLTAVLDLMERTRGECSYEVREIAGKTDHVVIVARGEAAEEIAEAVDRVTRKWKYPDL